MFNITHTSKPGICKARRCKHPAVDEGLCEKHYAEWTEAGRPPFGSEGTAMTVSSAIPKEIIESLPVEKLNAEKAYELVKAMEIDSQEAMDTAGVFLSSIREFRSNLEARRDAIYQPAKDRAEGIKQAFEPIRQVYVATEGDLREKINAHIRRQAAAAEAARVRVEAAGGQVDQDTLVVAHGVENVALPVGMGTTETWDYEVTDEQALRRAVLAAELVAVVDWPEDVLAAVLQTLGVAEPADPALLVPNHDTIKGIVRRLQDQAKIPGVRVFKKITARAARRARG